jgi:heme exporter protein B
VSYARRTWIVLWKDLTIEGRSKETLNALLFFALLLLFLFQFALGDDRERLAAALPGLLWLGFVLSGLVGLGRAFLAEREHDCWEGLVLAPGDKSAIYLGKVAGNLILMLAIEVITLVLFTIFFNVDVAGHPAALGAVLVLGTVGFAAVGTLFAAMTANIRAREVLFPVLLLPILIPVLLGAVKATEAVILGEPLSTVARWLQLLGAADIVYLTVGILTFDAVLEG